MSPPNGLQLGAGGEPKEVQKVNILATQNTFFSLFTGPESHKEWTSDFELLC